MIGATLAKVSTLLISVGLPHRPDSGRDRAAAAAAVPRLPSIEAISAVSSPQTNAPAPRRTSMLKLKVVPQMSLPSSPRCSACRMAVLQPLDGQRIFRPDVDVTLVRADRVAGDRHAFEHAMRVAFQHAAVHERAGIAFVGVADHVLLAAAVGLGDRAPLQPGGKAGAAAPAQPALRHLVDDLAAASFR